MNTYGYNEILTALQQGKAALGIEWMAATQTLTDCSQSPKVCKDGQPLLGYTFRSRIETGRWHDLSWNWRLELGLGDSCWRTRSAGSLQVH